RRREQALQLLLRRDEEPKAAGNIAGERANLGALRPLCGGRADQHQRKGSRQDGSKHGEPPGTVSGEWGVVSRKQRIVTSPWQPHGRFCAGSRRAPPALYSLFNSLLTTHSLQIPAEALDAPAGFFERRGGGRVGNTEGGAETEGRALHHRDAFRLQELGDEVLVAGERLAARRLAPHGAGARRVHVERAVRLRALDAVGLVEHGDHEVAPLLEDGVVLRDEVLRPVERLDRGPLRDG